ncbi:hypothetical protein H4I95_00116 [Botrytis cinerea]
MWRDVCRQMSCRNKHCLGRCAHGTRLEGQWYSFLASTFLPRLNNPSGVNSQEEQCISRSVRPVV